MGKSLHAAGAMQEDKEVVRPAVEARGSVIATERTLNEYDEASRFCIVSKEQGMCATVRIQH